MCTSTLQDIWIQYNISSFRVTHHLTHTWIPMQRRPGPTGEKPSSQLVGAKRPLDAPPPGREVEWEWAKRHGLLEKFVAQLAREADVDMLRSECSQGRYTRCDRQRLREVQSVQRGEGCSSDHPLGTLVTPSEDPPFALGAQDVHYILRPDQLTSAESSFLERVGIDGNESPVRSFHAAVLDCLEKKPERQADPAKHELFFFSRRRRYACTGLVMLVRRTGPNMRTRGTTFEMRRIASEGEKGAGARLHWHLCDALVQYASRHCRWEPHEELSMVLTLQSCTWRAGGFYKKMGWEHSSGARQAGSPAALVGVADLGGMLNLDLRDRDAWSRYWRSDASASASEASPGHGRLEDRCDSTASSHHERGTGSCKQRGMPPDAARVTTPRVLRR